MIKQIFLAVVAFSTVLILATTARAESYQYDGAGRLTQVTYDDGSSIAYSYDANGNMLSKTVAGVGTTNLPPLAFDLVYPANQATGVDTAPTFIWKQTTDPDGDPVTYQLTVCEDPQLAGCTPQPVTAARAPQRSHSWRMADAGWLTLAVLGLFALRRRMPVHLAPALLVLVLVLVIATASCGGGSSANGDDAGPSDGGVPSPRMDEIGHLVTGLSPGTTYYWKVTASDDNGGVTDSATWSFTTEGQ